MSALGALVAAKARAAGHAAASVRRESKLKIAVVSVSAVVLWLGAAAVFSKGFQLLRAYTLDPTGTGLDLGDVVMARLLSVFSLALFFMLLFSNVLVAYATLYRSREVEFLVQSPLSFRTLFVARFLEIVTFSSWASAFLGSPLILAYGTSADAPAAFYIAAAAFYIPFVCIPAALGSLVAMVLALVLPRIPRFVLLVVFLALAAAVFVYFRGTLDVERITDQLLVSSLLEAGARTQSPFLPSHWAARGVLAAASGRFAESVFNFLLILSNALMLTWLAAETAARVFHPGWSARTGEGKARIKPAGRGLLGRLEGFLRPLPEPIRSLVAKDIKLFWRDATQWSQFVIFFGLMAFYIASLKNRGFEDEGAVWRTWIASLNLAACTLILATLTSRFVFPLISLEGRRFWVIGLAPLTFRQLVWQKFGLSVTTCMAFTLGLIVLSGRVLNLEPLPFALSVYTIVLTNLALSGLAVGLGALYPNFHEDNPARIVSGMGGTLNFLLSMAYILVVLGVLTAFLLWRALRGAFVPPEAMTMNLGAALAFITVLSAMAMILPLYLGLRHLRSLEF